MRSSKFPLSLTFVCLMLSLPVFSDDDDTHDWLSNYKEAIAEARRTGKPIFLEYRCEP